jgi:hypothetical protein
MCPVNHFTLLPDESFRRGFLPLYITGASGGKIYFQSKARIRLSTSGLLALSVDLGGRNFNKTFATLSPHMMWVM